MVYDVKAQGWMKTGFAGEVKKTGHEARRDSPMRELWEVKAMPTVVHKAPLLSPSSWASEEEDSRGTVP